MSDPLSHAVDSEPRSVPSPTTPSKPGLSNIPSANSRTSTQPTGYLFLLLLLAVVLLLIALYFVSRHHRSRRSATRHAGVNALTLDVEALTQQHPRTLSPSAPLPPRGWRFARLLRLPVRRRVVDDDADWELDVDEVGRAPPPYMGEAKEVGGMEGLPGYEEVCGVGVGNARADEVASRREVGPQVTVPERAVRRGSEGDRMRGPNEERRSRDDRERRRGSSFQ